MQKSGHFPIRALRRLASSIGVFLLVHCGAKELGEIDAPAPARPVPWKITGDFHYTPTPLPSATGDPPSGDGAEILTLEKLVVTQHKGARILEKLFADQARIHAAEAFSWEKGGVIHESANKRVVTKWIYKDDSHTIELLSFPW